MSGFIEQTPKKKIALSATLYWKSSRIRYSRHTSYLSQAPQAVLVEKNLSCGEIFPYDRLSCGEVSPHEKCEENLSHRESSPHDKFGAK